MMKYRGFYIDHVVYNSKEEIDAHLKEQAVKRFKNSVWLFWKNMDMESSIYSTTCGEVLHDEFGMDWSEIEELETATLEELSREQ